MLHTLYIFWWQLLVRVSSQLCICICICIYVLKTNQYFYSNAPQKVKKCLLWVIINLFTLSNNKSLCKQEKRIRWVEEWWFGKMLWVGWNDYIWRGLHTESWIWLILRNMSTVDAQTHHRIVWARVRKTRTCLSLEMTTGAKLRDPSDSSLKDSVHPEGGKTSTSTST